MELGTHAEDSIIVITFISFSNSSQCYGIRLLLVLFAINDLKLDSSIIKNKNISSLRKDLNSSSSLWLTSCYYLILLLTLKCALSFHQVI